MPRHVVQWVACSLAAVVAACDGGGSSFATRPPPSVSEGVAFTVSPAEIVDGVPRARIGATVSLTLPVSAPEGFDPDASSVTLTGVPLARADGDLWTRTLDGTEGDGLKSLDARLADRVGQVTRVLADDLDVPVAVVFDFTPPAADCTLSPASANGTSTIRFDVRPSEPLRAPPTLVASDPRLRIGDPAQVEGAWQWILSTDAPEDIASYTLTATAEDLAGNPQTGDSLCPVETRTGSLRALPPVVTVEPALTATPSVDIGGVPWVREGAVVRVSLATALPIDETASSVQLSGIPLAPKGGGLWEVTLDGTEGDGLRTLDARLVDDAGNETRVVRDDVIRFDFTPPVADCVLFPALANAQDTPTLQVFLSEPVAGTGPVVTADHGGLSVGLSSAVGQQFLYEVALVESVDIPSYTLTVTATDRVGNPQIGPSLCAEADRTGAFQGIPPEVTDGVALSVTPSVPDASSGLRRAGVGAVLTLTLPTVSPVEVKASIVTLSGIPLAHVSGATWSATLDGTEGDGPKSLDALLIDAAGNQTRVRSEDLADPVGFVADFTAPVPVTAVLSRSPYFDPAVDLDNRIVWFTDTDPLTGLPVDATLTVFASERLAAQVPLLVQGPITLEGVVGDPGGTAVVSFRFDDLQDAPEGEYTFTVVLEDDVGNRSSPRVLPVRMGVDRTGPASAPDVVTPGRIVYARTPWGSEATGGEPRHEVTGDPGAAEPGATVVLRSPIGGFLATTAAAADGSFAALRSAGDLPEVLVVQLDQAGNPSPAARVRDVLWTATLGGKVAGRFAENPHVFRETALFGPAREPGASRELSLGPATVEPLEAGDAGGTGGTGGVDPIPVDTSALTTGAARWQVAADGARPAGRASASMAPDFARGTLVLFGGFDLVASRTLGDTWTFDGTVWTEATPGFGSPSPRADMSVAWDPAGQRVLALGGTESGFLGGLYAWTGTAWVALDDGDDASSDASGDAASTGQLVSDLLRGTVWRLDAPGGATSMRVSRLEGDRFVSVDAANGPPARTGAAMAWDDARGEVVVFGGSSGSGLLGDTWVWNGGAWRQIDRDAAAPSARVDAAMAFDPVSGDVVLYGGAGDGLFPLGDTWSWDGAKWTARGNVGGPGALRDHALAVAPATGQLVLFGGRGSLGLSSDAIHTWDGARWVDITPGDRPAPRTGHRMVWDPVSEEVVLFGGCADGECPAADTWVWDGIRWTRRIDLVLSPAARTRPAMAWDDARETVVLWGGEGTGGARNDTWEWNGSSWASRVTAGVRPPARRGPAGATDPATGQAFIHGGEDDGALSDTWAFGGSRWFDVTPAPPGPAVFHAALTTDAVRGEAVLYGGDDPMGIASGTWVWDGTGWARRTTGAGPGPRRLAAMAWDPSREQVLLFGGEGQANALSDLWSWDGAAWTSVAVAGDKPAARTDAAAAFDAARGRLVLFGATNRGRGDVTWLLDSAAQGRPGHLLDVDWTAAGADDATILAVAARWTGGADGATGASGVTLRAWDGSRWRIGAQHDAPREAAAALCLAVRGLSQISAPEGCTVLTDPALLTRLFVGSDRTRLHVAAVPRAVNGALGAGPRWAGIRTEDVEVSVRYRLSGP